MSDYSQQRREMVLRQLSARNINDPRVLNALGTIPRELFVLKEERSYAYDDRPLSIGAGQTISQPYIVALMLQLLSVYPGDRVLEIGTGSGYQTALLAYLGAEVFSVECVEILADRARRILRSLNYAVNIRVGDGGEGWKEVSPFHKIIVSAGCPTIPSPLKQQLKVGGRIVLPVGFSTTYQEITVVDKISPTQFQERKECGCIFVPLQGAYGFKN